MLRSLPDMGTAGGFSRRRFRNGSRSGTFSTRIFEAVRPWSSLPFLQTETQVQRDCATNPSSYPGQPKRSLLLTCRSCRYSHSSLERTREKDGSLRSVSATTTPREGLRKLSQFLAWLTSVIGSVEKFGELPAGSVQQVLCTEYDAGVGIGWHRDKPHFDKIFGISLRASCKFRFRRSAGDKWERFTLTAEPRSLYMMSGESRQVWEHSIPAVEERRYSITFRTMKADVAGIRSRSRGTS